MYWPKQLEQGRVTTRKHQLSISKYLSEENILANSVTLSALEMSMNTGILKFDAKSLSYVAKSYQSHTFTIILSALENPV